MKIHPVLLGMLLSALPLPAAQSDRRVVAPCELTTASLMPSGGMNSVPGREFSIRVSNDSPRTVAIPRTPDFGWRVESYLKGRWHLKAEGGPTRRLSPTDPHIVVTGKAKDQPLVEIAPAHGETMLVSLPEVEKALQPEEPFSQYRLTLYWAASAELAATNPKVLPCALAAEWEVRVRKLPPPK
jgi:hypothetical protein